MIMHILASTPKWVFILFLALLWLGLQQLLPRSVSLSRATVVPLAMTGLSLYGVTSAFGDSGQALLAWIAGAVVVLSISFNLQSAPPIRFDARSRRFEMPGSAVPLVLFMGIFFTKYVVGVSIGMQPNLAQNSNFALTVSAIYGVFSGIFLARAAKLWRLALGQNLTAQDKLAAQ